MGMGFSNRLFSQQEQPTLKLNSNDGRERQQNDIKPQKNRLGDGRLINGVEKSEEKKILIPKIKRALHDQEVRGHASC